MSPHQKAVNCDCPRRIGIYIDSEDRNRYLRSASAAAAQAELVSLNRAQMAILRSGPIPQPPSPLLLSSRADFTDVPDDLELPPPAYTAFVQPPSYGATICQSSMTPRIMLGSSAGPVAFTSTTTRINRLRPRRPAPAARTCTFVCIGMLTGIVLVGVAIFAFATSVHNKKTKA